jgi:enoyl-CoA hydratase/carnithine racemase
VRCARRCCTSLRPANAPPNPARRRSSGNMITAQEASDYGLVSRVIPDAEGAAPSSGVLEAALKLAEEIASKGRLASIAAKEAVNTGA